MRVAFAAGAAVIALLLGCGSQGQGSGYLQLGSTLPSAAPVTVIAQPPVDGPSIPSATVELPSAPTRLSLLQGHVLVGTQNGVFTESLSSPGQLVAMKVIPEAAGPDATGSIQALAPRSNGGALVVGALGVFHDQGRFLVPSPLNDAFPTPPRSLDAFGDGEAEELWLLGDEVLHLRAGQLWYVRIPGLAEMPTVIMGVAPGRALVAAGGTLYEADMEARTSTELISGLGTVHGADRAEDGTVWLATDSGLVARDPEGHLTQHTFAKTGAPSVMTYSVSARFGDPVVSTAEGILQLGATGPVRVGSQDAETPSGDVIIDAQGDVWAIQGTALIRWATGNAVSFAADVQPVLQKHCASCHTGSNVPPINFDNYEVVSGKAQSIAERLQATDSKVMPPASEPALDPDDKAVVLRWATGLKLP